jgi:dsRNA-specific ribonuclease
LIAGALVGMGMTANAKYGESSNLELPSYIDYLIEKNTQPDRSAALYQGIDSTTLLRRLSEVETRLQEVPNLAQQRKWTQINGLVTGPLGTLSMTLNQIAAVPNASSKTKYFIKQIKSDVLGIGQAASKKNAEGCSKQAALASQDLKSLLQEAFE